VTTPGPCERLEWDSHFFGMPIARAGASRLDESGRRAILDWCRDEGIGCLYFLADPNDPATSVLLEDAGFHLVDIRVTLDAPVRAGAHRAAPTTRAARASDIPALRDIAGICHRNTRFYLDGHFSRERCDEMYRVWIERSCTSPTEYVIVAERNGGPVGYLTLSVSGAGRAIIGLVGVSPSHQRQGVGRELVEAGLAWLAERAVESVSVVTQGHNIASQALYQRAGFRTSGVMLWYHRWFPGPTSTP